MQKCPKNETNNCSSCNENKCKCPFFTKNSYLIIINIIFILLIIIIFIFGMKNDENFLASGIDEYLKTK